MKTPDHILNIIFGVIDEINTLYLDKGKVEKCVDAPLYAAGSTLDSVGLVNLVVAAEQRIEAEFGIVLILADEKATSLEDSPFKTVGAFAEYVARRLSTHTP
jgi:hypothetical protein